MANRAQTPQVARYGAILALVWVVTLAQPQALAGCGEHVTVLPSVDGPVASRPTTDHPGREHNPLPCTGPYCSRGSKPQPITTAILIDTRDSAPATPPAGRRLPPTDPAGRHTLEPVRAPDDPLPDPITHPPR